MEYLKYFGLNPTNKLNSTAKVNPTTNVSQPNLTEKKVKSTSRRQSHSARLRQSQHLRKSQNVGHSKTLKSANPTHKYRFNINLQNKNIKLLKKPIPIIRVRKELEKINSYFSKLLKENHTIFYRVYSYNEYDLNYIELLLYKLYNDIISSVNKIKEYILNDAIVNADTSIYNYYVTNFEKLQNEIYQTFTEIKPTNCRTLRYQVKQINGFINSYIENILN